MSANSIDVRVAGRNFTLACGPDERVDLEAAVELVNQRVEEAHAQSSNASGERLLLLAALNLAHDLRRIQSARGVALTSGVPVEGSAMAALKQRIEAALERNANT